MTVQIYRTVGDGLGKGLVVNVVIALETQNRANQDAVPDQHVQMDKFVAVEFV